MCGIAGIVDLTGQFRPVPPAIIRAMADAIRHRGPDDDGYLERPGVAFGSRRLSIVGLSDGRQPISNETGEISVVFNGELFEYPEVRNRLQKRGHKFRTHCDTEILPHEWEEHGEQSVAHLAGQFAFALHDARNQRVFLARDRTGVCPLYWSRTVANGGEWLLFASEVKSLIASGLYEPSADINGLHHFFTFFSFPGPVTCFRDVQMLAPGHCLNIQLHHGKAAIVTERTYWELDYPDWGQENHGSTARKLTDQFEELLLGSVTRRLRADVPVVSYLSGGVDSSTVAAMASHVKGKAIASFTIGIRGPLDETSWANRTVRFLGERYGEPDSRPVVVSCGPQEIYESYRELIAAAEVPVVDTSCAALLRLARAVREHGYKVALTGEGADEQLAGYPWHKVYRALSALDYIPLLNLSRRARRALLLLGGVDSAGVKRTLRAQEVFGGPNGWLDMYGLLGVCGLRLFSKHLRDALSDHEAWDDLQVTPRIVRWHPLNRELYLGMRINLPGLLLHAKGDRVAMRASVETRYPFLDEGIVAFLAGVPPSLKLHGFRDKHLLRLVAARWLPRDIAYRPKAIFRAPSSTIRFDSPDEASSGFRSAWVEDLLSDEALKRTGYFDPHAVRAERRWLSNLRIRRLRRPGVEKALMAVFATQLWHHTFLQALSGDVPSPT